MEVARLGFPRTRAVSLDAGGAATYERPVNKTVKRPSEAYHSTSLFELGMGQVTVARFKANGDVEVGVFLLDVFCLGVKNAFFTLLTTWEYDSEFLDQVFEKEGRTALSPACGRKLVEDAVAYAAHLGFSPHPDYRQAARVFGGINPRECDRTFTFGRDGKPLYIRGPHDPLHRVQAILDQLQRRCGEGGYHFVIGMPGDGFAGPGEA